MPTDGDTTTGDTINRSSDNKSEAYTTVVHD